MYFKLRYCALVGSNLESWGWDLGRNLLIHNDQNVVPVCYTNENVQSANGNTPYPMQKTKQVIEHIEDIILTFK